MQTTASIQRTAHLRPLTISIADIKAWLNAKSELFTHMSGFCVTRREVIRTKYTVSDELALQRHHQTDPDAYEAEWQSYCEFADAATTKAKKWLRVPL